MLRNLSRVQAWLVIVALALSCIWSTSLRTEAPTAPRHAANDYSDVKLYRDVAAAIADGQHYYPAVTSLQRHHGFPMKPFVKVRLPTLVLAGATFGWPVMHLALLALLVACALAWYARLDGQVSRPVQAAAIVALVLGGAMVTQAELVPQHDQWAGLLIATALALAGGRAWPLAVACAALAVAIREFAILFVLLALAIALFERRRREAAAWVTVAVTFAAGMWFHASAVAAHLQPGDLAAPPWGMRGPGAAIADLVEVSLLNAAPRMLAGPVAVLAYFGWTGGPPQLARFALIWLAGFGAAIAIMARDNNVYWAIELLPTWFVGLAFLPSAVRDLATAAARPRECPEASVETNAR